MAVGEPQWRNELPWWLVLIHVGLAALVWAWTVALVTALWRTPAYTDVDERAAHGRPARAAAARADCSVSRLERRRSGRDLAAGYLARIWGAERFADIDPEGFIDFQANRPHVSLDEGLTRRIEWPENALYHARIPGTERDVVLLLGVEPSLRWQTFSKLVVDLSRELGVELVVTLGSLLADVPHTARRP